jgi:hypothetical protein
MASRAKALVIERMPETEFIEELESIEFVVGRKRQGLGSVHHPKLAGGFAVHNRNQGCRTYRSNSQPCLEESSDFSADRYSHLRSSAGTFPWRGSPGTSCAGGLAGNPTNVSTSARAAISSFLRPARAHHVISFRSPSSLGPFFPERDTRLFWQVRDGSFLLRGSSRLLDVLFRRGPLFFGCHGKCISRG